MLLKRASVVGFAALLLLATPSAAFATHSWGSYHWARTSNPFTVRLGDNVSSTWDARLRTASSDWSKSSVLDSPVVSGAANVKSCKAASGRAEVCDAAYGNNGWLGLASISVRGSHITSGFVKLNDTYFNTPTYNNSAWRQLVVCQEVGHILGLDHQDVNFDNPNLGTCMDYTSDPTTNQHPNAHDYQELEIIYGSHLDSTTTLRSNATSHPGFAPDSGTARRSWGRAIRFSSDGSPSTFVRRVNGGRIFTFVIWAR